MAQAYIPRSIHEMHDHLAYMRNIAQIQGAKERADVLDAILYHMSTGRLSGSTEYAIMADYPAFRRRISRWRAADYATIGGKLHALYD